MASNIEQYLAELRAELAGADPALVQDALYDAEEHLRSELTDDADAEAFAAAVDAYGTPEEVAGAYRETERTVARALQAPAAPASGRGPLARFFGVLADPKAYGALFYALLSFATGIAYFTTVVTGLSLSLGLLITIVGVPMILLFIGIVRAISFAEGRMVEALLGVRMPRRPRTMPREGGWLERIKSWFVDYRTWTTMLYMLLQLPLGVAYFSAIISFASLCAGVIALPFVQLFTGEPVIYGTDYAYLVEPWAMPLLVVGGLLGLVVMLHAVKLVGRAHAAYAKVMLVGRVEGSAPEAA